MIPMLESIKDLDQAFLSKVNMQWTDPRLDEFFLWATNLHHDSTFLFWILPIFLCLLLWIYKKQAVRMIIALAVTITASDMLGARVFKPLFNRTRPHLENTAGVKLRLPYSPRNGSFPSNHAMNSFAVFVIVAHYIPWLGIPFFFIACIGAYSRMYVGVHYPSDIVAGAVVGIVLAFLILRLLRAIPFMRRAEQL